MSSSAAQGLWVGAERGSSWVAARILAADSRLVSLGAVVAVTGHGFAEGTVDESIREILTGATVCGNEDGWVAVPRASGEPVAGVVFRDGFLPGRFTGDSSDVVLEAMPASETAIRVFEPAGTPASEVLVLRPGGMSPLAKTDRVGNAVAPGLTHDDVEVLLLASDGRQGACSFSLDERAADAVACELPAPTRLEGRVVREEDRRPIAGALVWFREEPGWWAETDRRGFYALPGLRHASPTVEAAAAGYFDGRIRVLAAPAPARVAPTLALASAITREGTVVDESGRPVAQARITVSPRPGRRAGPPPRHVEPAESAPDGSFLLTRLTPGVAYEAIVEAAGFAPRRADIPALEPGDRPVPLSWMLHRGRLATGRVVDDQGTAVEGAEVHLLWEMEAVARKLLLAGRRLPQEGVVFSATTERQGIFEFRELPAGRFDLVVTAAGRAPLELPGVEIAAEDRQFDLGEITMEPAANLVGVVADSRRAPVAGAEVTLLLRHERGTLPHLGLGELRTDERGRFVVDGLSSGTAVDVQIRHPDFSTVRVPAVEVPTETPLEITLQPVSSLTGIVRDEAGAPVAGARVIAGKPRGLRSTAR
jgi:hypothetical protein